MEVQETAKKSLVETLSETLDRYQREMLEDTKIDVLTLSDKLMMVPAIKHKWVSRLMQHKLQLNKIQIYKKKRINELSKNLDTIVNSHVANNLTKNDEKYENMQEAEMILQNIVEYLEKSEKIFSSLTFDLKNLIEMQKMETT